MVIVIGVLHVLDHIFNQPARHIEWEVFVSAGLGWVALLGTLFLARRGDPWAAPAAMLTGLASAAGFAASHLAPDIFGPFSDSFQGLGVNALSWLLVAGSIVASLILAGIGAAETVRTFGGRSRIADIPVGEPDRD